GLTVQSAFPVRAVLLDLLMPGMDGLQTLARLRERDPALGIIMLTGIDSSRATRDALKLGAVDYLTKPFECEEVLAAVRAALGNGGTPAVRAVLPHAAGVAAVVRALGAVLETRGTTPGLAPVSALTARVVEYGATHYADATVDRAAQTLAVSRWTLAREFADE